jgi:hypothetical protein
MTAGDTLVPFKSKWLADGKSSDNTSEDEVTNDY